MDNAWAEAFLFVNAPNEGASSHQDGASCFVSKTMEKYDDFLKKEPKMDLLEDVQQYFPIQAFRFSQEEIIKQILSGKDVMAVLPTGAGKSICYQYPAMVLPGVTLVISPLIALMQDQTESLRKRNIPAACLNQEVTGKERRKLFMDAVEGKYKLLYISPERLLSPKFIRFAKKLHVSLLVVDEAHCTSLWGYDFRQEYLKIPRFFQMTDTRPVIAAFTATATEYVRNDVIRLLDMRDPFVIHEGYGRENLSLSVRHYKSNEAKFRSICSFLSEHAGQSGIIYCATVKYVQEVYQKLKSENYPVSCYFSDLDEGEKTKNFQSFMEGENTIMVSTNAFGMGIDKGDIRFVLHFNMSKDLEGYYQEIGRAGRDGRISECVLYYTPADINVFWDMIHSQIQRQDYPEQVEKILFQLAENRLQAMVDYAESGAELDGVALMQKIRDYFQRDSQEKLLSEKSEKIKTQLVQKLQEIDVLYTNETRVSNMIRAGAYVCGKDCAVEVGVSHGMKKTVNFCLDQQLEYFDLMVADAVYTLLVWGKKKVYPKNILCLLAGDPSATMKPSNSAKEANDKRRCIQDSMEKMMNTHIHIDRSRGKIGLCFPDEQDCLILDGPFLPLKKEGKNGYRILNTPPLYRYAELTNGQFFTIPHTLLCVWSHEKKLPNSVENLKLKHYLARRLILSQPHRARFSGKQISRIIRFVHKDRRRRGMFQILSLDFSEENKFLRKRRWNHVTDKVAEILEYYQSQNKIAGCRMIRAETELGTEEAVGVEMEYYLI